MLKNWWKMRGNFIKDVKGVEWQWYRGRLEEGVSVFENGVVPNPI